MSARPNQKAEAGAPVQGASILAPDRFLGTSNPRYLRIISALMTRARSREEIDRIAGASNGPDAIAEIRALGLPKKDCLVCERTTTFDRDGKEVKRGIYWLTPKGRRRLEQWLRARDEGHAQ